MAKGGSRVEMLGTRVHSSQRRFDERLGIVLGPGGQNAVVGGDNG